MTRTRNHRGEDLLYPMSDAHLVAKATIRAERPPVRGSRSPRADCLFADLTAAVAQVRHDGEGGREPVGHRADRHITRRRDGALSSVG